MGALIIACFVIVGLMYAPVVMVPVIALAAFFGVVMGAGYICMGLERIGWLK